MEVNKDDLVMANLAIKELQREVRQWELCTRQYAQLNRNLLERWERSQVEIERLKARLSEFEV